LNCTLVVDDDVLVCSRSSVILLSAVVDPSRRENTALVMYDLLESVRIGRGLPLSHEI